VSICLGNSICASVTPILLVPLLVTSVFAEETVHQENASATLELSQRSPVRITYQGKEYVASCLNGDEQHNKGITFSGTLLRSPNRGSKYFFQTRSVKMGDVIPIGHGLYRITAMRTRKKEPFPDVFVDLRLQKTVPDELKRSKDSLYFPFGASCHLEGCGFKPEFIRENGDSPDAVHTKIGLLFTGKVRDVRPPPSPQTVRVGEFLDFGEFAYKVTKIVSPDPSLKIGGWFELHKDPKPVGEAEDGKEE